MDEFQETLQRWLAGHDNRGPGVSAGGFCDMAWQWMEMGTSRVDSMN